MKKAITLFFLLFTIGFSTAIYAQSITNITQWPTNPSSNDTIYFYADVQFGSSDCQLDFASHTIVGNTITANTHHCVGILTAICNTTDTFVILPLTAGTYSFDLTLTSGSGGPPCSPGIVIDDNMVFTFSVFSASCGVELTGDSIICNWGNPQILTASPTSSTVLPVTYMWNTGQTGSVLTITIPGIYCVTQIDANGCIDTACITITVQDLPIYSAPSPPIICLGDSIVLEIDTAGLSNIVWIPTGSNNTINRVVDYPVTSTIYVVEAVDLAGCDRRGEVEVLIDTCATGIMNIMSAQVIIFPNPSNSVMTIQLPKSEVFDLIIFDVMGRLVLLDNKVSQTYIISDNTLSKGSYILHLSHAKGVITKKLVIE